MSFSYVGAALGVLSIILFLPYFFEEFHAAEEWMEEAVAALDEKYDKKLDPVTGQKRPVQHPTKKLVKQYSTVSIVDGRFLASTDHKHSQFFWSKNQFFLVYATAEFGVHLDFVNSREK